MRLWLKNLIAPSVLFGALSPSLGLRPNRSSRRAYRKPSKLYAPNGKRERERRMRQIAAGSLRVENGLAQ